MDRANMEIFLRKYQYSVHLSCRSQSLLKYFEYFDFLSLLSAIRLIVIAIAELLPRIANRFLTTKRKKEEDNDFEKLFRKYYFTKGG